MRNRPLSSIKRPSPTSSSSGSTLNNNNNNSNNTIGSTRDVVQRNLSGNYVLPETIYNNNNNNNQNHRRIRNGDKNNHQQNQNHKRYYHTIRKLFLSICKVLVTIGSYQIRLATICTLLCISTLFLTVIVLYNTITSSEEQQSLQLLQQPGQQLQQLYIPTTGRMNIRQKSSILERISSSFRRKQQQQQQQQIDEKPLYNNLQQQQYDHHQPTTTIISSLTKNFDILFTTSTRNMQQQQTSKNVSKYNNNRLINTNFIPLEILGRHRRRAMKKKDYNNIIIRHSNAIEHRLNRRSIIYNSVDNKQYDDLSSNTQDDDDHHDYYYSFDDDYIRNPYTGYNDDTIRDKKHCHRTNWHRRVPINCNTIHEFDLHTKFIYNHSNIIGGGSYRQVYTANVLYDSSNITDYIFKTFYYTSKYNYEDYEFMRMDALVAEIFSSNERIVNIYGYCALGMINDNMIYGDLEHIAVPRKGRISHPLPKGKESESHNTIQPLTKLLYSLEMIESVALLHGYKDGVIVHDDIQLSQFLINQHGHLLLNDFNRAEIMFYNVQDNEYCKYRNNPGHGDWRAPQEYKDEPLDEKIDIWSLGNNMYAILTGLYPLYDAQNTDHVQQLIKNGTTGYIDPGWLQKSLPERYIAQIIPLCWEYNPEKRIDIFQLLTLLRNAYNESKSASTIYFNNTSTSTSSTTNSSILHVIRQQQKQQQHLLGITKITNPHINPFKASIVKAARARQQQQHPIIQTNSTTQNVSTML